MLKLPDGTATVLMAGDWASINGRTGEVRFFRGGFEDDDCGSRIPLHAGESGPGSRIQFPADVVTRANIIDLAELLALVTGHRLGSIPVRKGGGDQWKIMF